MNLNSLSPAKGSVKNNTRKGRGSGSGKGGTSTRGHKGAKSRSGYSRKIGFEGGQMPLQRRVPKFGFKNLNRIAYKGINVSTLQTISEAKGIEEFTPEVFVELGLVSGKERVKVLGGGELSKKLTVTCHAVSASAKEIIEKNGGSVSTI
ncbi:50S ribosomal protein L15 [Luteibaculum oceani]|uniref:Large ribosomal subunit protein uL15 n=1 Tax=Luteibaculum oceani TaxID=1294296 RepID=A0A5C6V0P4_9FLAO|nr:50S ribosomal protein L15 [Luteibaculum oceani]TXC78430.1 50S ribosomal protein L15 [Luteibaculum oceani]